MSHKNAALAFDKPNSCLLGVQEWMSTGMFKLNPDKTEFIIFGSHAQLKKLDPYLPVKIFGSLMHPAVVVKKLQLVPGLMLISPLLIMSTIFVRRASFKFVILGG